MGQDFQKPYGVIYVITNLANQKVYVGQTTMTLLDRWKAHRNSKKGRLSAAIAKYGRDSFRMEAIQDCFSVEELNKAEIAHIARLRSSVHGVGYNATHGGSGKPNKEYLDSDRPNPLKGIPLSAETKAKISLAKLGKKQTPEHIENMRAAKLALNFRHTQESRRKMSESLAGYKRPAATEETKIRLSEAAKMQWANGRGHSPRKPQD